MALTIAEHGNTKDGQTFQIWVGLLTFDATYPAGGEPFDPTTDLDRDFNTVYGVFLNNAEPVADGGGYVPQFDATNNTIILYEAGADGAPLDETATVDQSSLTVHCMVIGN